MQVFVLFELGDHDDGGDQVRGVFTSRELAMAAVSVGKWQSWSDHKHGDGYEWIEVEPGQELPPDFSVVCSNMDREPRYEIHPRQVDTLT
jgi:hypothetical protein